MLRAAMRATGLLLLGLLGCDETAEPPLSYGRCTGTGLCGLETRCESLAISSADAAATVCTLPCAVDLDCPGLGGTCVRRVATTALDAGPGRCLRACNDDADCRPGTVCRDADRDAGSAPRLCVALVSAP